MKITVVPNGPLLIETKGRCTYSGTVARPPNLRVVRQLPAGGRVTPASGARAEPLH